MDKHLPHRETIEVELADFLIRVLDWMGRENIKIDNLNLNPIKTKSIPGHIIDLTNYTLSLAFDPSVFTFTEIISRTIQISQNLKLDLSGAVFEKIEYNKVRSDHKPENRIKKGGLRY